MVLSRGCRRDVSDCFSDVFCDFSVLSRWCVSDVLVMCRVCVSDVSVLFG